MTRKVVLSKDTLLWEEGDLSRNIAIVDSGKLAITVGGRLIGVVWPKMVIGESAIMTSEGEAKPERRTATVTAWEENTTVSEYPAGMVRRTFEDGSQTVTNAILTSLVGQICRNCLMIVTAYQSRPLVHLPFRSLMDGLLESFRDQAEQVTRWEDFQLAFKVLYSMRDSTESLREQLILSHDPEAVARASNFFRDVYKGSAGAHVEVEDYLRAESEKREWLSSFTR